MIEPEKIGATVTCGMDGIGAAKLLRREFAVGREGHGDQEKSTYRSAALFRAHDEREAQRLLDGGLAAVGLSAKELDSLPGSDVRKVAWQIWF